MGIVTFGSLLMTKDRIRQKIVRACLLGLVLLLGGYLRSVGLTWGLESGYGHYRNFQPDEFVSLRGVAAKPCAAGIGCNKFLLQPVSTRVDALKASHSF